MIDGNTTLIAHIGYPTHSFKAPLIYNPYFEHAGINAVVVPMGSRADDYPALLKAVFALSNIGGAAAHRHHHSVDAGVLKVRVVDQRRLEAMSRIADVRDQGGVAVDHLERTGLIEGKMAKTVGGSGSAADSC